MRVLASYNVKGGVGKTTTVVNLAHRAAVSGSRTLVFDLDPQGAASYYLRANPKVRRTGKALIRAKHDVADAVVPTDYPHLDLVPADFSFRNVDVVLDATKDPSDRLRRLVRPLAGHYDYVFFDCPPSISRLSESVFGAADALLIPLIPTTLSVRSLEQLRDFFGCSGGRPRRKPPGPVPLLLPFFSMVDRRKRLHRELIEELSAVPFGILATVVPSASAVERMGPHQAPVAAFAPRAAPAKAYATMWSEIVTRLGAAPEA
ncbi:MAG: ParA family protein [Acidimicrobiia bacterium]